MLAVEDIHTFYGLSHILFGVSLRVEPGEVVCLLGRNGAGMPGGEEERRQIPAVSS